jgi:hypothetical protein
MNRDEISNLYRGPSQDAPYQVLIHLAKWFQRRRFFRNQPIRNKNGLWRPCLLTDRDEMSNIYRGPAIDASYRVSVHLAKQFQRRRYSGYWWQFLVTQSTEIRRKSPSGENLESQTMDHCGCYVWRVQHSSKVRDSDSLCRFKTRGSVGWACVAHLSFCFEET